MLQLRLRFATECKNCGVKTDECWIWEHEVQEKFTCGNCHVNEVVLLDVLERVEIDPWKPRQ